MGTSNFLTSTCSSVYRDRAAVMPIVVLQDVFHAQQRVTAAQGMRRKHPEYAAARARLRDIFRTLLRGDLLVAGCWLMVDG